ncbi:MAG: hypothetical protein M3O03_03550 [Pseudomonadota bacterium]|nr:hypothetical protein [Pseudomonadota bacterium]
MVHILSALMFFANMFVARNASSSKSSFRSTVKTQAQQIFMLNIKIQKVFYRHWIIDDLIDENNGPKYSTGNPTPAETILSGTFHFKFLKTLPPNAPALSRAIKSNFSLQVVGVGSAFDDVWTVFLVAGRLPMLPRCFRG